MIVIKNRTVKNILKIAIPFLAIPLLVFCGGRIFGEKQHLFLSFIVAVLAVVFFLTGFEKKIVGSRRIVIVAVMTALCIVGRLIPFFKPITAITIITAMYLGAESGFLVGALAALISNFYFGQGPWTAFQMLAWGMIGLVAGYLAKPLKRNKFFLLLFGLLSGILYSFVMDLWNVLWYNGSFHMGLYLSAIITAIPHTILYTISNVVFICLFAKPFGEKLERIKIKYGV